VASKVGLQVALSCIRQGATAAGRDVASLDIIARLDLAIGVDRQAAYAVAKPMIISKEESEAKSWRNMGSTTLASNKAKPPTEAICDNLARLATLFRSIIDFIFPSQRLVNSKRVIHEEQLVILSRQFC
jgi:alkanesulfonate monooxygenase SsuD/methylene tetrahydromethanopterin reductase-like flavin-dependent oxidoreductase (luciferase family)